MRTDTSQIYQVRQQSTSEVTSLKLMELSSCILLILSSFILSNLRFCNGLGVQPSDLKDVINIFFSISQQLVLPK